MALAVNISPKAALHEYGVLLLRYEPIYRAVFENKPMRSFLGAFPGLDYWTMLGKAWWHTTETQDGRLRYDLVVLDAHMPKLDGYRITAQIRRNAATANTPVILLDSRPERIDVLRGFAAGAIDYRGLCKNTAA